MTHRDELLSIQARVEAQQREIDDAKSENALLRAAHAQKTREAETLRRELDELRGGVRTPHDSVARDTATRDPGEHDAEGLRWSMRLGASIMAGVALVGSMMLAVGASRGACHGARAHAARQLVTPLVRDGHVVATHGPEVVAIGEQCTVERMPAAAGSFDCRIEVRCGEQTLYGTSFESGYVRCGGREVVRDGDVTARDGDPAMTLDLARGRVVVEERVGLGTQRVEIALDPIVD